MAGERIYRIYIIAGEPSGDLLGASLITSLKRKLGRNVMVQGIGGPNMEEAGMQSLFPMQDISHMGFLEVLPHIPTILRRLRQTIKDIETFKPDAVVTIDSPGFNKRLVKKLKGKKSYHQPKFIHYVAPTVWAWRPKRAELMAKLFDHLLTLLPFEPPYFEPHGLTTTFVGHPIVQSDIVSGDGQLFIERHKLFDRGPFITLLPGSRAGEINHHMPLMHEIMRHLMSRYPRAMFLVPTVPQMKDKVEEAMKKTSHKYMVITDKHDKADAFAVSDVAVAASGTVTLELAMAKVPTVVFYKLNPLTYEIARRLISINYVSLINILSKNMIIPEFIQYDAKPRRVIDAVCRLLDNEDLREQQVAQSQKALEKLGLGQYNPADKAADAVIGVVTQTV